MSATSLSLLLVGLSTLYMSAHKPPVVTISSAKAVITVIGLVSAKYLFTYQAASHNLKQSLFSVRGAKVRLKPKKKRF